MGRRGRKYVSSAPQNVVLAIVTEAAERQAGFSRLGFGWDQLVDAAALKRADIFA